MLAPKTPTTSQRGIRTYRALRRLGANDRQARGVAAYTGQWWYASSRPTHTILTIRYFDKLGLYRLAK